MFIIVECPIVNQFAAIRELFHFNSLYCILWLTRHEMSSPSASDSSSGTPAEDAAKQPIKTDQFEHLMEAFQVSEIRIDHKLAQFHKEVKQGQGAVAKLL